MGAQRALGIPDQLLGGQPARALNISALDLADIQSRIQAGPGVMQQIGAQDAVFAGEGVDHHFGDGGPIGEIEKRATLSLDPVPLQTGGFVEPGGGQADAVQVAGVDRVREGDRSCADLDLTVGELDLIGAGLVQAGQTFGHPGNDLVTGMLRGHAVQVRPR